VAYVEALQPRSDTDALFASGQRVYQVYCSVCHQPTGMGIAGQNPPLADSEWVLTESADRLIRLVLDGIQGPIVVKGQNYNGAMPPWRELLTDEEIAAVLTYIRGNATWGNTAEPVTPAEVTALREQTATHNRPWTADELLKIPLSN
jgi:mono/diheme cytochrome c family protein